jgi:hypothetical protein
MIIDKIVEEIRHSNGNLSYRATMAILSSSHAHLYPNRRVHPDGYEWIYVGTCGKWSSEGKQQWVLNYNNHGELMPNLRDEQLDLF